MPKPPKTPLYPRSPRSLWFFPPDAPNDGAYPVVRGLEIPYDGATWSVIGWDAKKRLVYIAHGPEVRVIKNESQLAQFRMYWLPHKP